jgi:predicted ester cyclase
MATTNNNDTLCEATQQFNSGDLESYLTTLYARDAMLHFLPPGLPPGRDGARLFYSGFLAGFPDAQLWLDDTIIENDVMAVRYHMTATHTGPFNGIPATGKSVEFGGITIMRWQDGKVIERWSETDFMGLLQQLGVIPAPDSLREKG